MRQRRTKIFAIFGGLLGLCLGEALVIFHLAQITARPLSAKLRSDIQTIVDGQNQLELLKREARTRAAFYDHLIESSMLVDGMVADRDQNGKAIHLCDSLLFSALRYRALVGLGLTESASRAWNSLQLSRDKGHWWRHPLCSHDSLSRDMLMGLMIALEANPPGSRKIVQELLDEISSRGNGFFSDGPIFVSYLSPGPASLLRRMAERNNIPYAKWPWVLKQSFSSIEFDAPFLSPGYESHLAAMSIWLESRFSLSKEGFNPRSVLGEVERKLKGDESKNNTAIDRSRLIWISKSLVDANPQNLFFQFIEAQVAYGMTDEIRIVLLSKLLSMPQFPATRLPQDCNKDADYLWQRKDEEHTPTKPRCGMTYSGVDFIWMAALLTE